MKVGFLAQAWVVTLGPYSEWRAYLWQGPHRGQRTSVGGGDRMQSIGHVKLMIKHWNGAVGWWGQGQHDKLSLAQAPILQSAQYNYNPKQTQL